MLSIWKYRLNVNTDPYQYAVLYDMYSNFQSTYYEKNPKLLLIKVDFIKYLPLIVNKSLENAPVDVHLKFESRNNFPAGNFAYCLIVQNRIVQYNLVSGDVKKLVYK